MRRADLTRWFLRLVVVFLVLTAVVAIAIFVRGSFGETEAKILGTTFSLAVYSLTALAGAVLVGRGRLAFFGFATMGVSALALLAAQVQIWGDPEGESEALLKATLVALVLALTSAWASLLLSRRRDDDGGGISATLAGTLAAVAVLAVLVIVPIVRENEPRDFYWRLLGVVAVLAVLGTLLLPVLRRIAPSGDARQARTE